MNCTACHDLLLDFVYDLLDESQAIAVREHVAACPGCEAELARAKSDQLKLGRAALAILQVPEFEMPKATAPTPSPVETSPSPVSAPSPRRFGATPVAAWIAGVACCALAAVFVGWNHQHHGAVAEQTRRVAELNREQIQVNAQLASLDDSFVRQQKQFRATANASAVQLHVSGPGRLVPQVSAPIHVTLVDLENKPADGNVSIEFIDRQNQTLARSNLAVKGSADVPLPAELDEVNDSVRLKVTAEVAGRRVASVEQTIAPPPHDRAAHLAVNKLVYKAGDKVLLRALVLDRATLKPTADGARVRAAVVSESGVDVVSSPLLTVLAGMAAGEIALPAELIGGDYSIEVRGDDLIPVRRRIEVLSAMAPSVEVLTQQNNRHLPNTTIPLQIQAYNSDGSKAANAVVSGITNYLSNDRKDRNFDAKAKAEKFQTTTDKYGRFNVAVSPTDVANGFQAFEFDVALGAEKKDRARVRYVLQMQPTRMAVDFYPEGGTLVAGAKNKVFFRIRAAESDVPVSAQITVRADGKSGEVYRSLADESLGFFMVTPEFKKGLTVQFRSPKQPEQRVPFEQIGIAKEGVIINGLGVQTGGGPVRLELENQGEARLVQLVVTCRSEVVAHRRLELKGKQTLDLPVTVDGVLRVTAFDVREGELVPLAERLIYRAPVRRLDLDVALGAKVAPRPEEGKNEIAASDRRKDEPLNLNIRGRNEAGDALACWALASIVDERFLDGPEPSLSAHFLLLGDDADWADAPMIGLDSPANRPALEYALGIDGWRRVSAPSIKGAGPLAKAVPETKMMPGGVAKKIADIPAGVEAAKLASNAARANAPTATFFYRIAPGLQELRKTLDDDWTLAQINLLDASKKRQAELLRENETVRGALAVAQRELQALEDLPRERFMIALGVSTLGLLIVGSLAIVFGLVQLARQHAASPAFCLAAGSLAGCLAILMFRPEIPTASLVVAELKPSIPSEFRTAERPAVPGEAGAVRIVNGGLLLEPKADPRREVALLEDRAGRLAESAVRNSRGGGFGAADEQQVVRNEPANKGGLSQVLREAERNQMQSANARASVTLQKFAAEPMAAARPGFGGNEGAGGPVASPPSAPSPPTAFQDSIPPSQTGGSGIARPGAVVQNQAVDPKADQAKTAVQIAPGAPVGEVHARAELLRDKAVDVERLANKLAERRSIDLNALKRDFASRKSQDVHDPVTALWNPALFVPAAGTTVPLDLPSGPSRFRVTIFGHTDDGRLGLYDGVLEITSDRK